MLERLKENKDNMLGSSKWLNKVLKNWGPLLRKGLIPQSVLNRRVTSHRKYLKQYIIHAKESGRLQEFNMAKDDTYTSLGIKRVPGVNKGVAYRFR
jgi:hypothetical protein